MSRYIVCYDISDDKRRQRIASILDSYGDRVQESIFELPVNSKLLQECKTLVMKSMDIKLDSLVIYTLCKNCDEKALYFGKLCATERIGSENVFIV